MKTQKLNYLAIITFLVISLGAVLWSWGIIYLIQKLIS